MASSYNSTHTETAKMEQVITEFFPKSLQIILESRSPYMSSRNYSGGHSASSPCSSSSPSTSVRPRDKWFNLALRECPDALENVDLWHPNNPGPMLVDVILVQRPLGGNAVSFSSKGDMAGNSSMKDRHLEFGVGETRNEKIIERWIVQYESRRSRDCGSGNRRSNNSLHTFYKKSILLLRSLYATLRLLPAYKIFRDINLTGQIPSYTLTHRVSSFVEPFTRKEEAEMERFVFTPVDNSYGRLCLSVLYLSSLSEVSSGSSTPMSPQFIPDYVGSPLAEPLKKFPSLPMSRGSPSSLPFSRRHSWSYDRYRASPPSFSLSPSPTHSEPRVSVSNPGSHRYPPTNLPPHPPETSSVHKQNSSFDEYYPSPILSPSPSPPIYDPGNHLYKALLRSESAPVSIPAAKFGSSPLFSDRLTLPQSPPLKDTRPVSPKLFSHGKDESKKYSVAKIPSSNSSQKYFSRSPSRSFPDDYDDSEFPCPFDVEDDDMTGQGSRKSNIKLLPCNIKFRPESFDQKCNAPEPAVLLPMRKSQDAAVGALVRMLKKAPPLRQDFSKSVDLLRMPGSNVEASKSLKGCSSSEASAVVQSSGVVSSGFIAPKTTKDALEELQSYKEMVKDLMLTPSV